MFVNLVSVESDCESVELLGNAYRSPNFDGKVVSSLVRYTILIVISPHLIQD